MSPALDTPPSVTYPLAQAMDARNLTVPVSPLNQAMIPLPDEATKAHILDAIALLESQLANPALSALCRVALGWYLDTLSEQQVADLSERMQLLIQRVALNHPALAA